MLAAGSDLVGTPVLANFQPFQVNSINSSQGSGTLTDILPKLAGFHSYTTNKKIMQVSPDPPVLHIPPDPVHLQLSPYQSLQQPA